MLIPHHHESIHLEYPLDEVSHNLIENLHLRWGYGVFQVEEYTDDHDQAICVVYGVATPNSVMMLVIVRLEEVERDVTQVTVDAGQPKTGGYPFNRPETLNDHQMSESSQTSKIVDDIFKFCTTPHGEGGGFADIMRTFFERVVTKSGPKDKRHYRNKG